MELTEIQIDEFISKSSLSGLVALYALKLSLETKVAFDRTDFCNAAFNSYSSEGYFYGFIVACVSLNLVTYNSKNTVWTVTFMNKYLFDNIDRIVSEKSDQMTKANIDIAKIRNYFQG